jgi:hypothetical protein
MSPSSRRSSADCPGEEEVDELPVTLREETMRILALEREVAGSSPADFQPYLVEEAWEVWRLMQANVIREVYFRADRRTAVLILECAEVAEAKQVLSQLPLVSAGLIDFEVIPLEPYSGFRRLFAD